MASTYNGQGIFNSGPHRFQVGASGSQLLSNGRLNPVAPGFTAIGALERTVIVRGRLVASSESALNTLLTAVAGQINSPPTRASLVDHHGRTYADMDFVEFTPGDRVDRGRLITMAYEARFVKLTS
jgi:hypothetical protein